MPTHIAAAAVGHATSRGRRELPRVLGPWSAAAIVVGTMLGTGIFIVPATMARECGSVALVMGAWLTGAALALFGALSYAELATSLPEAGGEYAYLGRGLGERTGFLFGWTHAVLIGPCSRAAIAAGLLQFATFLVPSLGVTLASLHVTPAQIGAVVAILTVAFVNYLGVRLSARVQVAVTSVKVAVLAAVIVIGFAAAGGATAGVGEAPVARVPSLAGFFAALVATLWAYDGWNNLTMVGSEIVAPQRSVPRALVGGVGCVAALYVLVNAACFYALPFERVAASSSVVADVVAAVLGAGVSFWLTLAMMLSALGSLNSDTLTGARVPWAMARDGLFFRPVARIDPRFQTPGVALAFQAVVGAGLALTGTFEDLYSLLVFAQWIFHGLTAVSLFALRAREPGLARPYKTPGYPVVPIIFIGGCLAVTASLWLQRPGRSSAGAAVILAGLLLHRAFRRGITT
jgi:APA family basic amino acid/polyamine antiporter